jgi:multiple sugar transport system permease protein
MSSRHDWVIWLLFISGLALIWAFAVLPVFNAIWLSLHTASSFIGTPRWAGLNNYASLLVDPDFWRATGNGFIYAGFCIVLQVVIGIVFALVLNTAFPLRWMVRGMAVLPYLLPTVVVALIFQWMTDGSFGVITVITQKLGLGVIPWLESPEAAMASVVMVSVWMWSPFVTVCCLAGMQSISPALYEAARVDGANAWYRFWHITLPQLRPVLSVVILLRAIWMFNKFDITWLLTKGGPLGTTEHLPILAYKRAFTMYDVGGGAAVSTLSFVLLTVCVFIYLRISPIEEKGTR